MALMSEPRRREWFAFLAGAVVMLLIGLIWLAWTRTGETMRVMRAGVALPRPELPSPVYPPPEGPRAPRLPLPTPK